MKSRFEPIAGAGRRIGKRVKERTHIWRFLNVSATSYATLATRSESSWSSSALRLRASGAGEVDASDDARRARATSAASAFLPACLSAFLMRESTRRSALAAFLALRARRRARRRSWRRGYGSPTKRAGRGAGISLDV